ncbi:MAG: acyl carrier protein [Alphaproteobacteria bacterium]|nr:acyl carrier protein [Alphaproteobacteria bacterium]
MSTFERVKELIVSKLGVDPNKITEKSAFTNDLGADSLDVVEFVMAVENEFNITISDEDAGKLVTVGDAVKYIDEHSKGAKTVKMDTIEGTSGKMAA